MPTSAAIQDPAAPTAGLCLRLQARRSGRDSRGHCIRPDFVTSSWTPAAVKRVTRATLRTASTTCVQSRTVQHGVGYQTTGHFPLFDQLSSHLALASRRRAPFRGNRWLSSAEIFCVACAGAKGEKDRGPRPPPRPDSAEAAAAEIGMQLPVGFDERQVIGTALKVQS